MKEVYRVAKNTGILYARMAITLFLTLYTTRLLLQALGLNNFGLLNLLVGVVSMLGFLNGSMTVSTQRFLSFAKGQANNENLNKIFNNGFILHLITSICVFLLIEVFGYFFFNEFLKIESNQIETAKYFFQFLVVGAIVNIIATPYDAIINAHENMLFFALLGLVESVSKLLIALFLVFFSDNKLIHFGALIALLTILMLILRVAYCRIYYPEYKVELISQYDRPLLMKMSVFAGWSFTGLTTGMVANYGQGILLNTFFGTVVNAAQGIANQVSGQLGALSVTMLRALNPLLAKSEGAGNRKMLLKVTIIGAKTSFFLLAFIYIPVIIEMPYILEFWLDSIPEFAVIFCRLLLIRNLIEQPFIPLNSAISAVGNIKKYQLWVSVLNITPLVLTYFLFRNNYPPYYLYLTFIFYSILLSSLILYFSNKNFDLNLRVFVPTVLFRLFSTFVIAFLVSILPFLYFESSFIRLIVVVLLNTAVFPLILWYVGLNSRERSILGKFLKGVLKKISSKWSNFI